MRHSFGKEWHQQNKFFGRERVKKEERQDKSTDRSASRCVASGPSTDRSASRCVASGPSTDRSASRCVASGPNTDRSASRCVASGPSGQLAVVWPLAQTLIGQLAVVWPLAQTLIGQLALCVASGPNTDRSASPLCGLWPKHSRSQLNATAVFTKPLVPNVCATSEEIKTKQTKNGRFMFIVNSDF